jgi:uroporphyrin-3 C-methyltransferase
LPNLDLTGVALRLDSVISQVDKMPLLSDEHPVQYPSTEPKNRPCFRASMQKPKLPARKPESADWLTQAKARWESWSNEMWSDVRQLVRVRSVETFGCALVVADAGVLRTGEPETAFAECASGAVVAQ